MINNEGVKDDMNEFRPIQVRTLRRMINEGVKDDMNEFWPIQVRTLRSTEIENQGVVAAWCSG